MIGFFALALAGLFAGYQVFARRIDRAAQPLRLKLAVDGEAFLQRPDLHSSARRHVGFLLATVFGMRWTILLGFFIVPGLAILALFRPSYVSQMGRVSMAEGSAEYLEFRDLNRLHGVITAANHPLLSAILSVEITLLLGTVLILRSAYDGVVSPLPGLEALLVGIAAIKDGVKRRALATIPPHAPAA